jgi:hypothetical protein
MTAREIRCPLTTKLLGECLQTNRRLRRVLNKAFPKVTFTVQSRIHNAVGSMDVRWQDGPSTRRVQAICNLFQRFLAAEAAGATPRFVPRAILAIRASKRAAESKIPKSSAKADQSKPSGNR